MKHASCAVEYRVANWPGQKRKYSFDMLLKGALNLIVHIRNNGCSAHAGLQPLEYFSVCQEKVRSDRESGIAFLRSLIYGI